MIRSDRPQALEQVGSATTCAPDSPPPAHPVAPTALLTGALAAPTWSDWPAALCRLVFEHLAFEDLVLCRRVCRQWCTMACDPLLQARCLLHSYPVAQRQALRKALQDSETRCDLAPWLQTLVTGSCPDQAQVKDRACRLSGPALLFRLVQQQVSSPGFAIAARHTVCSSRSVLEELACSPDGRWLATCHWEGGLPDNACDRVSLWRCGFAGLQAVMKAEPGPPVVGLRFGADSRSLSAVDCQGRWRCWSLDGEAHWRPVDSPALDLAAVNKATFSPDGRTLVLDALTEASLFCESTQGDWHKQWHKAADSRNLAYWHQFLWQPVLRRPAMFCGKSQHVLFKQDGDLILLHRDGKSWSRVALEGEDDFYRQAANQVLSPCSRWLALAFWGKDGVPRAGWTRLPLSVGLWRFSAHQGWRLWRRQSGITGQCASSMGPWPLVFSPDSEYLAFQQHREHDETQVCLLPVSDHRVQTQPQLLPIRQTDFGSGLRLSCDVVGLYFSANSRFLAAVAGMGISLWQRDPLHHWSCVARISNPRIDSDIQIACSPHDIRLAFSPDGFHCAWALGDSGDLAIWGATAAGGYVKKLQVSLGARVERLLFMPEGGRVLVTSVGPAQGEGRAAQLTCLTLGPAAAVAETAAETRTATIAPLD